MRIGIDLGGSKTEGIVMGHGGEILHRLRRTTPATWGYDAVLGNIADLVGELEQLAGQTCSVGIGTPGAISTVTGNLKNSNTVCLNNRPVQQDLSHMLSREIRMENDANCFALSEAVDGAGKGQNIVFGIIMGTGVGGGIVVGRQLISGAQHIAGEWGHNILEMNGPDCYCGRKGCVETFLSGPGLVNQYTANGGHVGVEPNEIVQQANRGETLAKKTMTDFLDRFGRAVATVINILDPDVVVIGGGLSNINYLYTGGRKRVEYYVFNDELRTAIVPNKHGDSSGVRGAAWLWPVIDS